MKISNWGNFPVVDVQVDSVSTIPEIQSSVLESVECIARGLGRCYGDSALAAKIIDMQGLNRILSFDPQTGIVECEAGVSLKDLIDVFLPKGWFLPVTPGTKFVTVGGAIASDVHGKNHHKVGSFSSHTLSFTLLNENGEILFCSESQNDKIFHATFGGMGLTGIILTAKFQLNPVETAFIAQETVKVNNLEHMIEVFEQSEPFTYSVAWTDILSSGSSLGRGVMIRGEHATLDQLNEEQKLTPFTIPQKPTVTLPFYLPQFVLNALTVKAFNALYFGKTPAGTNKSIVDYDSFFYPLDIVHQWNRGYGKRGFTQYQFVIPKESGLKALREIYTAIQQSGQGSFLVVLKLFGEQEGILNFPKRGYTLALDFAIKPQLFPLLDALDEIVKKYDGRLYLTKDVRMSKDMFDFGYPQRELFETIKKTTNVTGRFSSLQAKRLGL